MASYEEQLNELASGESWNMTNLKSLAIAVDEQVKKVDSVIAALPEYWKGRSSEVLLARLNTHKGNLVKLKEHIYSGQQQVTGDGEFMCMATCDNTDRREQAQIALQNLPSTYLPTSVLDQINAGAEVVEVATIGPVNLAAKGVGWITEQLSGNREKAAQQAVTELNGMITRRAEALVKRTVTFDEMPPPPPPPPTEPGLTPPGGVNPYGLNPGGSGGYGPGGLTPGGGGGGGGGNLPLQSGPGGPGDNGLYNPNNPDYPWGPNHPDYPNNPYDPNNPNYPGGNDGNGPGKYPYPTGPGGDGSYPHTPTGPSVDSGLTDGRTGSDVRSGLGSAGLGGVGLAAGAKLAGGGAGRLGGLGGFGGFGGGAGAGAGVGPGGIIGSTGAGGAGGSGSGSGSGAAKGAGAGRPGGMMMGGQGGGSSNKKGSVNRLGYVAPKYEDDYEENMPHPSARAGKRRD